MNKFVLGGAMGFMLGAGIGAGMLMTPGGNQMKRDMKHKANAVKKMVRNMM